MADLLNEPGVNSGIGHMCRFGMRVPESAGAGVGGRLVRKPTRRASSSGCLLYTSDAADDM
eukprot:13946938-Alexandrium_andersonii.AAC.1